MKFRWFNLLVCVLFAQFSFATTSQSPLGGDCDCDFFEIDVVCVDIMDEATGDSYTMSFPSMCFAECAGYTADDLVDCEEETDTGSDCDCDLSEFDPVCVNMSIDGLTSLEVQFQSPCVAACEGFTAEDFVDCNLGGGDDDGDDCGCNLFELEPVCVEGTDDATGETYTMSFMNMCLAECEGYTADDVVDCEDLTDAVDDCDCDSSVIDPVCVEFTMEDIGTFTAPFQNTCYAECYGFTAEDYVDCEDGFWAPSTIGAQAELPSFLQQNEQNNVEWMSTTTLAPNPVHDFTAIDFVSNNEGQYQISIIGIDGRTVSSTTIEAVKGVNTHVVDATNMQSGVYLVNITNAKNSKTLKMIKQ